MAFIKDEMETTLKEINKYGFIIRYLFIKEIISLEQFKNILLKSDIEERVLMFQKVLFLIKDEYYKDALNSISETFSKFNCIERANIKQTDSYEELSKVDINMLIDNETYLKILNEISTQYLLKEVEKSAATIREESITNSYKILLENIARENNDMITRSVNGYYLRKIR